MRTSVTFPDEFAATDVSNFIALEDTYSLSQYCLNFRGAETNIPQDYDNVADIDERSNLHAYIHYHTGLRKELRRKHIRKDPSLVKFIRTIGAPTCSLSLGSALGLAEVT